MAKTAKTVFGFCPTHAHAEEAVDRLRLSGFRNTDVSALMRNGGDIFGGVLGWAAGPMIPDKELAEYRNWLGAGGIVLCVRCANADWERRAQHVLESKVAAVAC